MNRLSVPFALAAVALVAACASERPATPAPAPVVVVPQQTPAPVVAAPSTPAVVVAQPVALKPGYGHVQTISMVPQSAGAGTTTASSDMRRLGVRMEDGTFQYVDAPSEGIKVGDRVQLTAEGYIRHPVP